MGKKYIIELESGTHIFVLGPEGIVHIGEPDVVYETVDGMQIGDAVINAKPYTEPDLEQVRKEEYDRGYDDAKGGYENGFENGMIVAWDVARKIQDTGGNLKWWIHNTTASEAIEKIRQYEQKQKEIKVGDEVKNTQTGVKFIVTHLWKNNRGEQGVSGFNQECSAFSTTLSLVVKTGRHFPEMAAVLEKMRGEQDGERREE